MNGRLLPAATIEEHGGLVACVAADSVLNLQWKRAMLQSSVPTRTSTTFLIICLLCLCLSTGCAFSKNLLTKSKPADSVLPARTTADSEMAKADCAVPQTIGRSNELTALPVAPPTVPQAFANVAPVNNALPQQAPLQQQVVAQQSVQQPGHVSAIPQQIPDPLQQPLPQVTQPQAAQSTPLATDAAIVSQAQLQPAPVASAATTSPGLPPATIQPVVEDPRSIGGAGLTAAPASALGAQAQTGSATTVICPPGTVPHYGYPTDVVSPPEKLAECEKQVYEMNQKLSELQFDTMKAKMTMEQMAEQQKQLLIDNERLRRRAEMADQRYLEELDTLSAIVGEVVSQAGSVNKVSPAGKPPRATNSLQPVPQSAAGQSL